MGNWDVKLYVHYFYFLSFGLRVLAIFRPYGVVLGGTRVSIDALVGNVIFYKSLEGFLESLPQSIYQTSIVLRQGVDISMIHIYSK